MQSPTPSPTDPIVVASLAQLAELEATGRQVRTFFSFNELAQQAWSLHAALYSLQSDGVQGADAVDLSAIEDLASLLETLRDEQAGR